MDQAERIINGEMDILEKLYQKDKPDYKKSPDELREGIFKPRLWSNKGKPINAQVLNESIIAADKEKLINEEDFFKEFE